MKQLVSDDTVMMAKPAGPSAFVDIAELLLHLEMHTPEHRGWSVFDGACDSEPELTLVVSKPVSGEEELGVGRAEKEAVVVGVDIPIVETVDVVHLRFGGV